MSAPGRVASRTVGQTTFTSSEAAEAIALVDKSGMVATLEAHLPTGGRPRTLSTRALLVALLLAARSGQPTYLNRLPGLLNTLPPSARHTLRLGRARVTERMVGVLFSHIAAALDGSPNYGGADLDADQRAQLDARLQLVTDQLTAATLPDDAEYTAGGDLAFDATIIDANSRPEATRRRRAIRAAARRAAEAGDSTAVADLVANDDALAAALGLDTWGENATREQRGEQAARARRDARRAADRDATTIVHKGRLRHSYAVHLAVDIPTRDHVAAQLARDADEAAALVEGRQPGARLPVPVPLLVRRMTVTASTAAPGATGSALLTSLPASPPGQRNRWEPSDLVADRGYSNATPSNWHTPLRAAGYHLIHDLHPTRRGNTATHDGAVIIDGQAYSPGILDYPDLVTVDPPAIGATRATIEAHQAVIELRRPFLLPRHAAAAPGQPVRLSCPALRNKLACPARGTLHLTALGAPEVFTPPAAPLPSLCAHRTVRLPADVLAHAQDRDLLYGSTAWYDAYTRRRPRVEGFNGIVKNPAGGHVGSMRIRVRGRAKVTLMVAFIVAAANLAAIDSWRAACRRVAALNRAAEQARASRRPAQPTPPGPGRRRTDQPRAPAA